ncbi:HDOD domain-containing protein [Marinibactrum halimedae]|uniref:HDOD domain-containing protein n=2 Tax=Marinibactrum halimedae TaxID=1444977 RepID=A0AA37T5R0_9GAMM|nr:HDOD domain-containing protein [Marinibactrum halimedae]
MGTDLTDEQIKFVLQGITVPPQPQIMVDLQMEQLSPNCSLQNIAKLISQDVGLAGSVIKTVNSPFLGLSNKITSVKQAVNLLGINSVVNLVNGLSIRGELSDDNIVAMGRFWDSAMEVAMASAAIAKQIGFFSPDEAYTLGLFHNCGIPLLMMRFDNYMEVVHHAYQDPDHIITAVENKQLNTNHAVVGYYVGRSWNLPNHITRAIHEHHQVEKIIDNDNEDHQKKTLLAILKMAEHICGLHRILGDTSEDYEWQRIQEAVLLYVGMSEYDFTTLSQSINEMGIGVSQFV